MLGTIIVCAMLSVIDGDTIKCDGQNMRLLGQGVPFVSGVDTPEIGSHAKCVKIELSGARDRTQMRRPLVNVYLPDGREIGHLMLVEGFAREWRPKHRNNWCE